MSFNFGSSASKPASSQGFSFGKSSTTTTGGAFGFNSSVGTAGAATTGGFGGFGTATTGSSFSLQPQTQTQQLQQQQQQRSSMNTPFANLDENTKKIWQQMEAFLRQKRLGSENIDKVLNTMDLDSVSEEVSNLKQRFSTLETLLHEDSQQVLCFKQEVHKLLKHAEAALRLLERVKSSVGGPLYVGGREMTSLPSTYFWDLLRQFEEAMQKIRQNITDLENHLADPFHSGKFSPEVLEGIMRNQHVVFMKVASQVALLHDKVLELKDEYLLERRKYYGDAADPFKAADKKATDRARVAKMLQERSLIPTGPVIPQQQQQQQQQQMAAGTTSFGGFSLSSPNKGASGFGGFGTSAAAGTGGGFSLTKPAATTTTGFSKPGGMGFGTASSPGQATSAGGFSFGAKPTTPAQGGSGFSFSNKPTTGSGGFSFGK